MIVDLQRSLTDHSRDNMWRGRENDMWLATAMRRENWCHTVQDETRKLNKLARARWGPARLNRLARA